VVIGGDGPGRDRPGPSSNPTPKKVRKLGKKGRDVIRRLCPADHRRRFTLFGAAGKQVEQYPANWTRAGVELAKETGATRTLTCARLEGD